MIYLDFQWQSVANILINHHDTEVAICFDDSALIKVKQDSKKSTLKSTEGKYLKMSYFLMTMTDCSDFEYREYLKLIMNICLSNLKHLSDSSFVDRQVYDQIHKSDSWGRRYIDSIEGFNRTFEKEYKNDNYSFCFCIILAMMLERTISVDDPNSKFTNYRANKEITKNQFESSIYKVFATPKISERKVDNLIISWAISPGKAVYINLFVTKLLTLLIKIGDEKSIFLLISNPLFVVQDAASLASAMQLAIISENQPLLTALKKMLKDIEPKHPTLELAESYLRKFDLLTKSKFSNEQINNMSGIDFEFALKKSLSKHLNFEAVQSTPNSGDYGADLILVTKHSTRIAVQCKRFSSKVNLKAVQEVVAAIKHYGCDLGVVISNNGFLQSAHELAKSNAIELWDGEAVLKIFAEEFDFSEIFSI